MVYAYYLLGASAMVLPYLKPAGSFPRLAGGALALLVAIFGLVSAGTIGVYGSERARVFAWPAIEYVHVINYPYLLMEQGGLFLSIAWLTLMLIGTAYLCYTVALGASQIAGVLDYKRFVWLIALVKLVLMPLPRTVAQTKWLFGQVAWWGWTAYLAYPLFLWLAAVALRRRGRRR